MQTKAPVADFSLHFLLPEAGMKPTIKMQGEKSYDKRKFKLETEILYHMGRAVSFADHQCRPANGDNFLPY